MDAPFIFIGTYRIREGKLEEFRKGMAAFCRFVEEHEPQLIAFNMYLDEAGEEVSVVQVHPDVRSMETHMQVVRDHIEQAYVDTLDAAVNMQVYGALSDSALKTMRQLSAPDVPIIVKRQHLAGFTRSAARTQATPA